MFCWGLGSRGSTSGKLLSAFGKKVKPLQALLVSVGPRCRAEQYYLFPSVYTRGAEDRPGPAQPSCLDGHRSPSSTPISEAPLWWWLCPLSPVAFPCLTGNHTTQGKECLGVGDRQAALRDPVLPLPRLFPPPSHPAATAWWAWLRVCAAP